jgi:LacI family transcriptional regulator
MHNTTLKDIAKATGLSISTVSRLLNAKYDAKSEKAKRVAKIAKKLGYMPNHAAVMLRTNSSKTLGLIIPYINNGFFSTILEGIESELKKFGYRVVICQSNDSSDEEKEAIMQLMRFKVDGIIISLAKNTQNLELLASLNRTSTKVLQFDRTIDHENVPSLEMQDEKATALAMVALLELGFKSFLYVGLSPDIINDNSRYLGYQNGLNDGCSLKRYYPEEINAEELKKEIDGIDCILCYNDSIGVDILLALKKLNISIPQQISVLGFDDRPFCQWITPTLSSISRPIELLGKNAAQHILNDINEKLELEEVILERPQLIIRESILTR